MYACCSKLEHGPSPIIFLASKASQTTGRVQGNRQRRVENLIYPKTRGIGERRSQWGTAHFYVWHASSTDSGFGSGSGPVSWLSD